MTTPPTPSVLTLTKDHGAADLDGVTKMGIGASWDTTSGGSGALLGALRKARGTDLDVFAILLNGNDPVRYAGLDVTDPLQNGAVTSTGDNQTGRGDGDDELIEVTFDRVPAQVTSIVFICAAYKKGSDFKKAANVSFKVYDSTGGSTQQVADIWPSLLGSGNAIAVAKAYRVGASWKLEVINTRGTVKQGDQESLLRFAVNK
ncbi:TerD family protein [Streptomyces sp. NBC_00083]|uniref:TerD family protein n=1 Tax=Streptomyces sp. NBC_00083 TaxID=2975647 RepID=UPI0022597544|nr:TerD family protein [Streptomyces sp. NBC_00083]MCX5385129.1 TerD family protein [Streptomyces sp. NBC_00083]